MSHSTAGGWLSDNPGDKILMRVQLHASYTLQSIQCLYTDRSLGNKHCGTQSGISNFFELDEGDYVLTSHNTVTFTY